MINFSKTPFIRLLFPFLTGIFTSTILNLNLNVLIPLIAVFTILLIAFIYKRKNTSSVKSYLYLFISDLFLFLSAIYSCYYANPKNNSDYFGHFISKDKLIWEAQVEELPIEKEKFYKVILEIQSLKNAGNARKTHGQVLAYFKKPFNPQLISPGNRIEVASELLEIPEPLNPHEFNYKEFLGHKGIFFQTFVEAESIKKTGYNDGFSLRLLGLKIKTKILEQFNSSELSEQAAQLCSALLTGYDDEISKETINAFAHSGTLHVLSVSGLHTGIIYAIIVFFLGIIDRQNRFRVLHPVLLLFVLFVLVILTGFSPPVLRASIMLGFLAIGKYYYNYLENASLNIMGVSAFLLLLFDPFLIYDAGFLLSYSAIIGILLFVPYLTSLVQTENRVVQKIWQLSAVSIAAQISTLPITLYYFHQFPLWFVLSNLIVIPLCSVIMILAILYSIKISIAAPVINYLCGLILAIVQVTDVPQFGYIDKIDFNGIDFMFMAIVIIVVSLFIKYKSYVLLRTSLILVLCWQCISLIASYERKNESFIGVYHVNKSQVIECKNANQTISFAKIDKSNYDYHVRNNNITYNYPTSFSFDFDYVLSEKISFLHVKSGREMGLINLLKPEIILFSFNPPVNKDFSFSYKPTKVIVDGSNKYSFLKDLKDLTQNAEIPCYSTRENGFIKLNL